MKLDIDLPISELVTACNRCGALALVRGERERMPKVGERLTKCMIPYEVEAGTCTGDNVVIGRFLMTPPEET